MKMSTFQLPADIACERIALPDGTPCWTFRHAELGGLGRIMTRSVSGNLCQIDCEIAGDPEDPMMVRRKEVFGPIAKAITKELERQMGGTANEATHPIPLPPSDGSRLVPSNFLQCSRCNGFYAHLVFAEQALTVGDIEDLARVAFPMIKKADLPTWIIGAPMEAGVPDKTRCMVLKVWPEREDLCWLTPGEFNPLTEELERKHCDKKVHRLDADKDEEADS